MTASAGNGHPLRWKGTQGGFRQAGRFSRASARVPRGGPSRSLLPAVAAPEVLRTLGPPVMALAPAGDGVVGAQCARVPVAGGDGLVGACGRVALPVGVAAPARTSDARAAVSYSIRHSVFSRSGTPRRRHSSSRSSAPRRCPQPDEPGPGSRRSTPGTDPNATAHPPAQTPQTPTGYLPAPTSPTGTPHPPGGRSSPPPGPGSPTRPTQWTQPPDSDLANKRHIALAVTRGLGFVEQHGRPKVGIVR